jgi:hypothetical protein
MKISKFLDTSNIYKISDNELNESDWSRFYKGRVGDSYPEYASQKYNPFIREILAGNPQKVCEEGCGISTISKIIKKIEPDVKVTCTDRDKDQLKLAEKNMKNTNCNFGIGNILSQKHKDFYDVIFSHGVLEHFPDAQIKQIIERQKLFGKKIVHYVPTSGYDKPGFGDERLMTIERWNKLVKPSYIKTWNGGKDAVLVWQ